MWHPDSVFDEAGHLDEGVVHAWLDGELASEPAAQLEAHGRACDVCAARIAEARGLVAGARRVLGALDEPAESVAPAWHPPVQRPGRAGRIPRFTTRRASIAAAAGLVLAVGSLVVSDQLGRGTGLRRPAIFETGASAPPAGVSPEAPAGPAAPAPSVPVPSAPVAAAPQASAPPAPPSATGVALGGRELAMRERAMTDERRAPDAAEVAFAMPTAAPTAAVDATRADEAPGNAGRATADAALRTQPSGRVARSRSATGVQVAAESLLGRTSGAIPSAQASAPVSGQAPTAAADRTAERTVQATPVDSARRFFSAPAQLEDIVVTGVASAPTDTPDWSADAPLVGCWRLNGSDTLVVFGQRAAAGGGEDDRLWALRRAAVVELVVRGRRSPRRWEGRVEGAGSLRLATTDSAPAVALLISRGRLIRHVCP